MKKYLSTIHEKPVHHKKRFAFAVSGSFTLFMFAIWSFVNFGQGGLLAEEAQVVKKNEIGPIGSLAASVSSSFDAMAEAIGGFKSGIQNTFDMESDYEEMRDGVLNTYGR